MGIDGFSSVYFTWCPIDFRTSSPSLRNSSANSSSVKEDSEQNLFFFSYAFESAIFLPSFSPYLFLLLLLAGGAVGVAPVSVVVAIVVAVSPVVDAGSAA